VILLYRSVLLPFTVQTSIHRCQTPPTYRHAVHGSRCTCQPPPFGIAPITAKRDVIRKTGSTQHSETPPEEDRVTATWDPYTKLHADRFSGSGDMLADRETDSQTDRRILAQTDGLITILRTSIPERSNNFSKTVSTTCSTVYLHKLLAQIILPGQIAIYVCLEVNQDERNRIRCAQRLVLLHAQT